MLIWKKSIFIKLNVIENIGDEKGTGHLGERAVSGKVQEWGIRLY